MSYTHLDKIKHFAHAVRVLALTPGPARPGGAASERKGRRRGESGGLVRVPATGFNAFHEDDEETTTHSAFGTGGEKGALPSWRLLEEREWGFKNRVLTFPIGVAIGDFAWTLRSVLWAVR